MTSLWSRVSNLRFTLEQADRSPLQTIVSPQFTRHTTVLHLRGAGAEGQGEDVIYETPDQLAFQSASIPDLKGEYSLAEFSERLDGVDLFCGHPPASAASRDYRRWTFESAALELALGQNRLTLAEALDRTPRPVSFVVSLGLGHPPSLDPIEKRLALNPNMKFKLDAGASWDRELCRSLAATSAIRTVDLKGYYSGTPVDLDPDPELYRRVAEEFPEAWIEDPKLDERTLPALEPFLDRLSFDAPIHRIADVEALPMQPRCLNIKPSRSGRLKDLLDLYEHCESRSIKMYSGGQFELGPGRLQVQRFASLFHPDASNDCSPIAFHSSEIDPNWPTSPLGLDVL